MKIFSSDGDTRSTATDTESRIDIHTEKKHLDKGNSVKRKEAFDEIVCSRGPEINVYLLYRVRFIPVTRVFLAAAGVR